MWLEWLPWKMIVRQAARSHGFLDPLAFLSHLRSFAQPSEVHEPIELMRAGAAFHARGFMNSRIIQNNLDWVWPVWVVRQFSPDCDTFIPRAFSLTHVNLSGRNWTAVGVPQESLYPIVDPAGLVTPFWDGWSLDAWIADDDTLLAPSRMRGVQQEFLFDQGITIRTAVEWRKMNLETRVWGESAGKQLFCRMNITGFADRSGWLIISLRPYNPEGVSFIHAIEFDPSISRWVINNKHHVFLDIPPDSHKLSIYAQGDVSLLVHKPEPAEYKAACHVGMVTAAAMYKLRPGVPMSVQVSVPLKDTDGFSAHQSFESGSARQRWQNALEGACQIELPDDHFCFLYNAALRSAILHSPLDIYPGPFTYKRFWFRDAALILQALIRTGLLKTAQRAIDAFLSRQTAFGYFHSQAGEWDSNGQVLWIMRLFSKAANMPPKDHWLHSIVRGASWIIHKRVSKHLGTHHDGLLPAGFSAEHLGPNDFYYWDDFWSVAGLRAAADMLRGTAQEKHAAEFDNQANDLMMSIESSLQTCRDRLGRPAMPASPYRRLDSGAIGSLAAGYPLDLFEPSDPRLTDLADYLMQSSIINGGFYHDIIHSGVNPYLTLHLAQVLMRAQDSRFTELVRGIARLASPAGQWPEAINPRTQTGCMGDGQHIWSAAEWIMMMVRLFVYEHAGKLVLAAGIFPEWLRQDRALSIGPIHTSYGPLSLTLRPQGSTVRIEWTAKWHTLPAPPMEIRLPGTAPVEVSPAQNSIDLKTSM